jgi:outer membrane protein assembly factor BamB
MPGREPVGSRIREASGRDLQEVRVCRACGHIDPVDSKGRCPDCGLFSELACMPLSAAERLARRRRRRVWRRRLVRLFMVLALVGGVTAWASRAFFDLGLTPPQATTSISAISAPHAWAQFRRTSYNSGFTPDAAPFPQRITWTFHTSRPLLASPAVVGDYVYLATGDGRTVALDQRTGQPVWEYRHGEASSSTPAVAGDMVIFATRPGRVVALSRRAGTLRWEAKLRQVILASPIVVQGTVYIGAADRKLYALDAATGRQRWAFTTKDWVVAAVAHADDRVLVASQNSRLYGVGVDTGRQRFVYDTGLGRHIVAAPAIQGERAYFGALHGRVWAIDWQTTTYPLERLLLFCQSNLYIWGMRAAPPVQKGSVWSRSVGGDVIHTPAIAHSTVYVTTARGTVVALDAATGTERWRTDLGVDSTAAPIVAGTTVLVGTRAGSVFGLHAHGGEVLWDFKTGGKISGSPIVAGDTMYVVSHDGTLYAVTRAE